MLQQMQQGPPQQMQQGPPAGSSQQAANAFNNASSGGQSQPQQHQPGMTVSAPSQPSLLSQNSLESGHRPAAAKGCCFRCIPTGSIGLFEVAGKFDGVIDPGRGHFCLGWSHIKIVYVGVQNHVFDSDCKTKDNTLIKIITQVQYTVMRSKIKLAIYDTIDPMENLGAQIDSVLRTTIPRLTLDEVYAAKNEIVQEISQAVRAPMEQRGYDISKVLITDVQPDPQIVATMNQINAERRNRDAAYDKGEAEKIIQIAEAEAEAEAMQKAGWGLKEMRKAMADGFSESVEGLAESGSYTVDQAMHMMMAAQYLDTLKDFAEKGNSSIVLPSGPGGVAEIQRQVEEGFRAHSDAASLKPKNKAPDGNLKSFLKVADS